MGEELALRLGRRYRLWTKSLDTGRTDESIHAVQQSQNPVQRGGLRSDQPIIRHDTISGRKNKKAAEIFSSAVFQKKSDVRVLLSILFNIVFR